METNVKVMNNKECESKWGKEEFSASQMMCVFGDGGSCDVCKEYLIHQILLFKQVLVMNYDRMGLKCWSVS